MNFNDCIDHYGHNDYFTDGESYYDSSEFYDYYTENYYPDHNQMYYQNPEVPFETSTEESAGPSSGNNENFQTAQKLDKPK